jgi:hypothetical protein
MWRIRNVKNSVARRWRIKRVMWQAELLSLLGSVPEMMRGRQDKKGKRFRMKIVSVSDNKRIRIR